MNRHLAVLALFLVALAGCATTQEVAVTQNQAYCPFLGSAVCAKLVQQKLEGRFSSTGPAESLAALRYVDANASWRTYKSVMLQPVTFWAPDDQKISAKDQLVLTNFFYQSLEKNLGTVFTLVRDPGPGVMRVQVAIEDVTTATPVLRSISMIIPQARVLATLKEAATGTYPFVGSIQAETKITDSVTGAVLIAAVDKRVGSGALQSAAQWELGDAENAITAWSQQLTDRLTGFTQGTAKP